MARVYRSEAPEPPPMVVAPDEIARQKRLAKQQREDYERRFRDPDPVPVVSFDDGERPESMRLDQFLALWTWTSVDELKDTPIRWHGDARPGWVLLGFRWVRMTPKRIRKWRRQCGLRKGDVLHIASLHTGPPLHAPLHTKRQPRPMRAKGARRAVSGPMRRLKGQNRRPAVDMRRAKWGKLPRCEYRHQRGNDRSRCEHKAIWRVGYTVSGTATKSHPSVTRIKHGCRRHGWTRSLLPKNAIWPVRVLAKAFFRWEES